MSFISKLRAKVRAWTASNEEAAERYREQRRLLADARKEAHQNDLAIARADQTLLRDRLAKMDEKLEKAEKKR
ncbi:hypothetical protein SJ05684_c10500 [Sinorhizobium sojae CCBAU 05684]|uniref:Uncharacterized protein n=1 Tax=Sinorhizobium sojae CCBAU 05684 TaxID=716928 RepID=A0A249P9Y3_9HYPH|nr:hypothetical protein [Sinorhizobium sojae]ASY62507.1 hypothetical protein SJ05684_c10500 [Sinorhizobium sojae CCBAU 05684]